MKIYELKIQDQKERLKRELLPLLVKERMDKIEPIPFEKKYQCLLTGGDVETGLVNIKQEESGYQASSNIIKGMGGEGETEELALFSLGFKISEFLKDSEVFLPGMFAPVKLSADQLATILLVMAKDFELIHKDASSRAEGLRDE